MIPSTRKPESCRECGGGRALIQATDPEHGECLLCPRCAWTGGQDAFMQDLIDAARELGVEHDEQGGSGAPLAFQVAAVAALERAIDLGCAALDGQNFTPAITAALRVEACEGKVNLHRMQNRPAGRAS